MKNKEEAYEELLALVKIMITRLVVYWTMNTFIGKLEDVKATLLKNQEKQLLNFYKIL